MPKAWKAGLRLGGRQQEARELLEDLERDRAQQRPLPQRPVAGCAAGRGP